MGRARRSICFVTGTRAEFGLMASTLRAIANHPRLRLQIVACGMHLLSRHGRTISALRSEGWTIDATVAWNAGKNTRSDVARATGRTMAGLASAFESLRSDVVLVVGDRVEAFAAAAAGHLCGRVVAHVHGGDRALGQVDDALRHAVTKLAHVHFAATRASARRICRLGEDQWRVHQVGAPGIDGIVEDAAPRDVLTREIPAAGRAFALIVLHPVDADSAVESRRARMVLDAVVEAGLDSRIIIFPNNDPGAAGIMRVWRTAKGITTSRNLSRPEFLGLLRDASVLVGNSSAGIIEAASFGTPVVDIGPRQSGREHGGNVRHVDYDIDAIRHAVVAVAGRRWRGRNPYGGRGAGEKIAQALASLQLDARLRCKLITY